MTNVTETVEFFNLIIQHGWNGKMYGHAIYINSIKYTLSLEQVPLFTQLGYFEAYDPFFQLITINLDYYARERKEIRFKNPDGFTADQGTWASKIDVWKNISWHVELDVHTVQGRSTLLRVKVYQNELWYIVTNGKAKRAHYESEIEEFIEWANSLS